MSRNYLVFGDIEGKLDVPNCAVEVLVHARIRDVFSYHLRVQETVTANAAMPLVAGEDVRTSLGAFRIVFGIGHFSRSNPQGAICRFGRPFNSSWSSTSMAIGPTVPDKL